MISEKSAKKSFTRQLDQSDCGVACLLSVMKYYGGESSLEKLRELSGTSKQGTTVLGLYQASMQLGMDTQALEGDIKNLKEVSSPCILHVVIDKRLQHYVVCYGYENGKFLIGDPASGISQYTEEKLEEIWQSKALILPQPNKDFVKAEKLATEKWYWLKKLIEEDVNVLGIALFMGIVVALLSLSTALFSQKLIDDILPEKKLLKLQVGIALLLFLLLVRSGILFLRQRFLNDQGRAFNNRIINHFYGTLLHLPKSFFDNRKTGELVARMNDTSRIQNAVSYLGANLMIDVLLAIVSSIFIFGFSWHLGVVALAAFPLYFVCTFIFHKSIVDSQRAVMATYARNESNYVDTIQGIGVIKAGNKEGMFSSLTKSVYDIFQVAVLNLGQVRIRFNAYTEVLGSILIVSIIAWGSFKVLNEEMKLGEFMAVLQMVGILMPAAGRLALTNIQLQEAKVAFDRMYEYTSNQPEYDPEKDASKTAITHFEVLRAEHISFRFPGRKMLISDVSFELKLGEMIAILGESGCGKSTTMQILQKFYQPSGGTITVNGIDWENISAQGWRNIVSVVPQDIKIFSGNVVDNICLSDSPEEAQQVVTFCNALGFDKFFNQLPQGYNTILGEEGVKLSGGQQQLVAIARALYRKPQVLLLDEATAAMDRNTEAFILNILAQLKGHISIVMVTHRVKTARNADCIYVMENGKMMAGGTHAELMQGDNLYAISWKEMSV